MKKLLSVLLGLLFVLSSSIVAYADVAEPDFDDWYVICGPVEYPFVDRTSSHEIYKESSLKPGTKVMVHSYNKNDDTYTMVIEDKRYTNGEGIRIFSISLSDLEQYFFDQNSVASEDLGKDLKQEQKCIVTGDGGVHLRRGPSQDYESILVVPKNTKISYDHLYDDGNLKWGFIKYNGQQGWLCIKYTEKITSKSATTTTKKPTESKSNTTTDIGKADTTTMAEYETERKTEIVSAVETANVSNEFFSSTKNIIVTICVGAAILSLTAVVILIILKQKKK